MEIGYNVATYVLNGQSFYFLEIAHPMRAGLLVFSNKNDCREAMRRCARELNGCRYNKQVEIPLDFVSLYLEAAYNQAGALFSNIDNHQIYISPV